jgi:hypothetical protein
MDSTFIAVMLILLVASAVGLVVGRFARLIAVLWLALISLFCVYGFVASFELGRGITYSHIGYAVIAVGCLGSGTRLLFTKVEGRNPQQKEVRETIHEIAMTFLAGLAGAAAAFVVSFASSLVGTMVEQFLNTTVVSWEMAPVIVTIFVTVGGFVAGVFGSFSRSVVLASVIGAICLGSSLTWMCLKSGSPTGVVIWGISAGILSGAASGATGGLMGRRMKCAARIPLGHHWRAG